MFSRKVNLMPSLKIYDLIATKFSIPATDEVAAAIKEFDENERLQKAILQLADGDLEKFHYLCECARQDYRDVLMWAENPISAEEAKEEVAELTNWLTAQGVTVEWESDEKDE
jgi:hypothetical protein